MQYRPMQRKGYVIINPYGGVWHDGLFPTVDAARQYLKDYWKDSRPLSDLDTYEIAEGTATYEVKMVYEAKPKATFEVNEG
jgi:hypothetical protein